MADVTPRVCVWCSSDEDVQDLRNEPRCGRCRTAERTLAEAREFVSFYGLRPLGGSVECDDEEEREHRVAAREARTELNRIRSHTPPRRTSRSTRSRPAPNTAGKGATGRTQRVRPGSARPTDVSRPDRAELVSRAEGLLAQLADIENSLEIAQNESGLSGKAKVSDLTAKRDSVLRTLAALEKAKRALEPAAADAT